MFYVYILNHGDMYSFCVCEWMRDGVGLQGGSSLVDYVEKVN